MRSVIVMGLLLAAVIILVRVIMGTPFIKGVRSSVEGFQDAGASLGFQMCPQSSNLYMYDGAAYCCSGIVNTEADTVQQTCIRPFAKQGVEPVFCTLGPGQPGTPNCAELVAIMNEQAAIGVCPSSMPYGANGVCCSAPTDSAGNCPAGASTCPVTTNDFENATNCRFLKGIEEQVCPSGYQSATIQGQGTLTGLTLYGCSDQNNICYSELMVARLGELGYDASALTVCGS
jgi:hypothetical protein